MTSADGLGQVSRYGGGAPSAGEQISGRYTAVLLHNLLFGSVLRLKPVPTQNPPLTPSLVAPPQGTIADGAPVVPISAQLKYNVDVVCEYIVKKIPVPVRWGAQRTQRTIGLPWGRGDAACTRKGNTRPGRRDRGLPV